MESDVFEIGGELIEPGSRRTVNLPISVMPDHTPVNMPVHVINGKRPGPKMFVSAGVHGDEIIGVEIVRRLLTLPNLKTLRGTFLAVPVVNTFGFLNHSRYLPDRRDLNRCFPGSASGSLASRLAYIFMNEIVKKCQFGIDLHSAAVHRVNLPQIRISQENPVTSKFAKVFGAPVILKSGLREGSLRLSAKEAGVDVLLYEAGEALRFDEMSARAGVMGILRVMRELDMIPAKGVRNAKKESLFCQASRWLRAPQGGLLRTYKSEGDVIQTGEVLAVISDPFGRVEHEITAELNGIIIGRAMLPVVNEGDAIFHVARVSNDEAEETLDVLAAQLEGEPLFDEDEII